MNQPDRNLVETNTLREPLLPIVPIVVADVAARLGNGDQKTWKDLQPPSDREPFLLPSGMIPDAIDQAMQGTVNQPKLEKIPQPDNNYLNQFEPEDFINLVEALLMTLQESNPHDRYEDMMAFLNGKRQDITGQLPDNFRMDKFVTSILRPIRRLNGIDVVKELRVVLENATDVSNILVQNFFGFYTSGIELETQDTPEVNQLNEAATQTSPRELRLNPNLLKLVFLLMLITTLTAACFPNKSDKSAGQQPQTTYSTDSSQAHVNVENPVEKQLLTIDEVLSLGTAEHVLKKGEYLSTVASYLQDHSGRPMEYQVAVAALTRLNPVTPSNTSDVPGFLNPATGGVAGEGTVIKIPHFPGIPPEYIRPAEAIRQMEINKITGHTVQSGENLSVIATNYGFSNVWDFAAQVKILPPGSQGLDPDSMDNETFESLPSVDPNAILQVDAQLFWRVNVVPDPSVTP